MVKTKKSIFAEDAKTWSYEIVVITRDAQGNPTGTKSHKSDNAVDIDEFFQRTTGVKKKGKPQKKVSKATESELKSNDTTGRTLA